jgi:uncharacterized membrane protein
MNTRPQKIEGLVLVTILVTVGFLAGLASFTHVKDWTLDNSPAGTGAWFGWANAAISELIPIAALLTIRRRKRTGQPIGYPMFLLVAAVCLSLAAQLAVAKPGLSGWLLSAVPALAFLGLSKLVLAPTPAPTPVSSPTADGVPPAPAAEAIPDNPPVVAPEPVTVPPVIVRPTGLVPVPATAFTRLNGATVHPEVTR